MKVEMKSLAIILGAAMLGSCSTAPASPTGAQAEEQLARVLAGKTAGPATSCMPEYKTSLPSVIAPRAIAFRASPGLVYVSDVAGTGCEGLTGSNYSLVTSSRGANGLCSGDIVQIVNSTTGQMVGSCALGPIVPYRAP